MAFKPKEKHELQGLVLDSARFVKSSELAKLPDGRKVHLQFEVKGCVKATSSILSSLAGQNLARYELAYEKTKQKEGRAQRAADKGEAKQPSPQKKAKKATEVLPKDPKLSGKREESEEENEPTPLERTSSKNSKGSEKSKNKHTPEKSVSVPSPTPARKL